jgi:DNA uptake protein ComE-like DNA-binding protein
MEPKIIIPTTISKLRISMFILIFAFVASGYSQQTDLKNEQRIEELVEKMAEMDEAGTESTLLLDDLSYYSTHPIFINRATEEELLRLNLMNFKQVRSIIAYREKYGKILSISELSLTGNFSEDFLRKIKPFIFFEQVRDSLQIKKEKDIHQSFLTRVKTTYPISDGYFPSKGKPPAYGGSPNGYFARYRGEVGKWLDVGITAENDAGEAFFNHSNKFFDFLSGFICWNGTRLIRKIVVGDFHLRFGQGINLWSGGGVSYASDLSSLMRTAEGIRPYSSTDENQFFRGVAVQLNLKPLKLSLFFSDKHKDANLTADSSGNNLITSFRTDGFHRTISELQDEKNVGELMLGGYADFRFKNWRFGILASCRKFGLPVTNGDLPYKSKTFDGELNANSGIDYHLILNQISLFGEAGISQNRKLALVNGLIWKAHPRLSLSFLYRFYDPAFQSFNSGAFAEGSGSRDEEGLFAAFEFDPVAKLKLSGQADLFYFPWMTYQTISPSQGRTLAFQAELTLKQGLVVYFHSRYVCKPQKISGITGIPEQWDEITTKNRIHCDLKISDQIQFRSRIEHVGYFYNQKAENGFLIFQDFIYTPTPKLKCWMRVGWYHTDGYNSRVFSYENDLLYYFAIPEFYGVGFRTYLNFKWQPIRFMTVYLKTGYTLREGATIIGSGNDTTHGNCRMDLRGQLCLTF